MEHEDNAQFDNFLQNTQHNLQHGNNNTVGANEGLGLDAGIGCGGVGPDDLVVGSANAGSGKYEELDENRHFAHDDNEWKYISELHQNEKKTTSNGNNNLHAQYNNDNHDNDKDNHDDDDDDDDDEEDADMPSMQYRNNNDTTPNGNGEHLNGKHLDLGAGNYHHEIYEIDMNKADVGDFSTTSNTISTADGGDIGGVQADLMHAEINFDNQQQIHQEQQQQQQQHDLEEEDPSSNCTSSLSENLPQQQLQQHEQQQQQLLLSSQVEQSNKFELDDKENSDPFSVGVVAQHPTDLQFNDSHAFLLNPDAKEFVPSFSSNPTSPTISEADHPVGEPVEPALQQQQQQQQQQPQLSALTRHLLLAGDDDFVARSPQKGREMDIDGLALPPSENEFEHEAAMRPHELEQEEDLIGDSSIVAAGANDLPLDVAAEIITNTTTTTSSTVYNTTDEEQIKQFNDGADYVLHGGEKRENLQSPESFIDHDVEINMDIENGTSEHHNVSDVMERSMYEGSAISGNLEQEPDQIENILNSVQPLPTDIESLDYSFDDDAIVATPEEMRGAKELLHDYDEKDHVSHPPSIEEMQLNLQNDFNASNKDIAQIPSDLDMNSAAHMEESFYMEHHATEEQHQLLDQDVNTFKNPASDFNESLLLNSSVPFESNTSLLSTATTTTNNHEHIPDDNTQAAFDYNNPTNAASEQLLINTDFTTATKDMNYDEQQQHDFDTNASSPSPHSTVEEKHLVEETKEQMVAKVIDATQEFVDELEQKMENLLYSGLDDGNLKQNAEPFEQKEETSFMQEEHQPQQQPSENEHFDELQQQTPNEHPINEIAYEKQITVEASEVEPLIEENKHVEDLAAPIEIVSAEPKINAELLEVAGVAGVAVAAVAAAQNITTTKKSETAVKKTATTATKSAAALSTKPIKKTVSAAATETARKVPAKPSTFNISARPRTAPAKTTTTTTTSTSSGRATSAVATTLAKKTVTTAAPKATGVGLAASRTIAKTTTTSARLTATNRTSTTTTSVISKTTTSTTTATARKSATSPTAAAKPRPASSQPTKAAVPAVKPKISPRATLASQLRNKTVGTGVVATSTTGATSTVTKSPVKTSSLSNGVGANKTTTSLGTARPKPAVAASTVKTTTTTATTKTFTARPAPKTSTVPTTVRRTLLQQGNTTTTTTSTTKPLSKTSPVKGSPSASKVASPRTTGSTFLRHNGQTKDAANAAKSPITKPKTMSSAKSPVKTGSPAAISKRIQKVVDAKPEDEMAVKIDNTNIVKEDVEIKKDNDNEKNEQLINTVGDAVYNNLVGEGENDVSMFSKDNLTTVDRDSENLI